MVSDLQKYLYCCFTSAGASWGDRSDCEDESYPVALHLSGDDKITLEMVGDGGDKVDKSEKGDYFKRNADKLNQVDARRRLAGPKSYGGELPFVVRGNRRKRAGNRAIRAKLEDLRE